MDVDSCTSGWLLLLAQLPGTSSSAQAALWGREYDEFAERCTALLDEIGKETRAGKFTFAEMEENEQDLEKLARWRAKIEARDFFPDERRQQSAAMMARCRSAMEAFSQAVYATEEVQEIAGGVAQDPMA